MKKRILTFLLAIVMIVSFLPANALAFSFNDDYECELYTFDSGKDAYAISHIDIFADIVTPVSINGEVYEYHQPLTTADAQHVYYSGKYADGTTAYAKLVRVGTSEDEERGLQIRLGDDSTSEDNYLEAGTENDPVFWTVSFNKTTKLYISDDKISSTPFSGAEEYEIPISLTITVDYWSDQNECPGGPDEEYPIPFVYSGIDIDLGTVYTAFTYTLTYHVVGDTVYGTPKDSVTPDSVDGIKHNADEALESVPTTSWTTSDGTVNGVPGKWTVSEYWTEDANNPDKADITDGKLEKIKSDKDVYVKWTFTPDAYKLTYNVDGDETYGTPTDSVTPSQVTGITRNGSVDPLAEIPTTSWTTSDGADSGIPGKWTFTPFWSSDDTYADELTKVEGIKEDKNVYGKWTFMPDAYTLTYNVEGDKTYGTPSDSVTPTQVTGIDWNGSVDPLADIPTTSWTTSDGTNSGIPGKWEFTPFWSNDNTYANELTKVEGIKENKNVYGKWTFTPDAYTLTYHVVGDKTYGTPSDCVTPDSVDGIKHNADEELEPVPTTSWTTSDGTANGVPGKWTVSEYWTEDANNPSKADITDGKIEKIKSNKEVYAKWTFTPDGYSLTYHVEGDETYGTPSDSVTPTQVTGITWNDSVDPLADIPTTSWTTSDGTDSGIPGKWEFTPAWSSDTTYADELTKVDRIKEDKDVYGKWTFTPDTYTLTYNVDGDETYGTPTDSVTPSQVTGITWNGSVDPLAEIPTTSWTTSDGTDNGIPGTWEFTPEWSGDDTYADGLTKVESIKEDKDVYGKWTFTPCTYTLTYKVVGDSEYGVPDEKSAKAPDQVTDISYDTDKTLAGDRATTWTNSDGTDSGIPGTWTFTGWSSDTAYGDDITEKNIKQDETVYGKWVFTPNTYEVTYVVEPDDKWGVPGDSVTPEDDTAYDYKDDVTVEDDLTSAQDYAVDPGTGDEIPGTWTFTPWDKDEFRITENTTITGGWIFTPDIYEVTYVVEPDDKWGVPGDSVTPEDDTVYDYKDNVIVEENLTTLQDYAVNPNTGDKVPGAWIFTPWDREDFQITEDTVITGSWTFVPNVYKVDYVVKEDPQWGIPKDSKTPTDISAYEYKDDVTVADDLTTKQDYAVDTETGDEVPGTWTFTPWDKDDFQITENTTITGSWTFVPNTYKVDYTVNADPKWGSPEDSKTPTDATTYDYKDDVTVADDLTTKQGYAVDPKTGDNVPGTWTFTPWDKNDFQITKDTVIIGSWSFTPNTYKVEYVVIGDKTYGLPMDAKTPIDPTTYNYKDSVDVADALTSSCNYAIKDGKKVKGTWKFVIWDKEDFLITEDTVITGAWQFIPDENSTNPSLPQTGDNSNLGLWSALFAVSGIALICIGLGKKKNQSNAVGA